MSSALVIANVGLLGVNILLICLIYRQVRHMYRPVITTKVISHEASVEDTPTTLVSGDPCLVVSNASPNQATNLRIGYEFWLKDRRIARVERTLGYLNPKEAIKELMPLGVILRDYPELFEELSQRNETKKIPKKTLALHLEISITHGLFLRHKIADSYKIEWGSLENYPRFEDHPVTHCWNMRNGVYVYKVGGHIMSG